MRIVAKLFGGLLGKSMEAFIDDMLVKSKEESSHVEDLANWFQIMKDFNLCLNSKNCVFTVQGGKFLWYIVTQRGIEPNLEKVKVVLDMKPPTSITDVQSLIGRPVALSRFLSKSTYQVLTFFEVMKKRGGFKWTSECQSSFEELKQYMLSPCCSKNLTRERCYSYTYRNHRKQSISFGKRGGPSAPPSVLRGASPKR